MEKWKSLILTVFLDRCYTVGSFLFSLKSILCYKTCDVELAFQISFILCDTIHFDLFTVYTLGFGHKLSEANSISWSNFLPSLSSGIFISLIKCIKRTYIYNDIFFKPIRCDSKPQDEGNSNKMFVHKHCVCKISYSFEKCRSYFVCHKT
jgi:hypothetical protein